MGGVRSAQCHDEGEGEGFVVLNAVDEGAWAAVVWLVDASKCLIEAGEVLWYVAEWFGYGWCGLEDGVDCSEDGPGGCAFARGVDGEVVQGFHEFLELFGGSVVAELCQAPSTGGASAGCGGVCAWVGDDDVGGVGNLGVAAEEFYFAGHHHPGALCKLFGGQACLEEGGVDASCPEG